MNILVLHNPAGEILTPEDADVLVQARAVTAALRELGHGAAVSPWPGNPSQIEGLVRAERPEMVFNLVESIQGSARDVSLVPEHIRRLGLPCTGCSSRTLLHSTSKILAKDVLAAHGLPTPPWMGAQGRGNARTPGRFIVKSVWEHASFGLDEDNVIQASSPARLLAEMAARRLRLGGECLAEEYIPGREFNIAVLEKQRRPMVLAPAEILFHGYTRGKNRVVGYRAKWLEQSFEYRNTRRRLEFPDSDSPLLGRLAALAEQCWEAFGLSGYARIDLRVDARGRPWIIDVNANPCLSPDAGFQASSAASGLEFAEVVDLLLKAAADAAWLENAHVPAHVSQ